jgi:hypothetical protein
LIALTLQYL